MVTSTVAIAMVWAFIYQADGGVLNSVLAVFGIKNPPVLKYGFKVHKADKFRHINHIPLRKAQIKLFSTRG